MPNADSLSALGYYQKGRQINNKTPLPTRFHISGFQPSDDGNASTDCVWEDGTLFIYETLYELEKRPPPINSNEFELHVFGDLKKYIFHYLFYYIHPPDSDLYEVYLGPKEGVSKYEDLGTVVDPCGKKPGFYGLPIKNAIIKSNSENVKINGELFYKQQKESGQVEGRREEIKKVELSEFMEPEKLAEQAALLNLNLMTWRMAPKLDLDLISDKTFLILGCGTLGCNVLRCLIVTITHFYPIF